MKRLLVVLAGCIALFAAAPAQAQARECGLPHRYPLWIDFADGVTRPGVTVCWPSERWAGGARSAIWITPVPLGQPVAGGAVTVGTTEVGTEVDWDDPDALVAVTATRRVVPASTWAHSPSMHVTRAAWVN